jgi:uncharacterized Zn finger protein
VAQRKAQAVRASEKLRKKGVTLQPVRLNGRTIARSFWGKSWCEHLEKFSDFENRLPRGRSYVRNGSVFHLDIKSGGIEARVAGSRLYNVKIAIKPLSAKKWKEMKARCAGGVGTLLELLQGRLSTQVMATVTDRERGLFPLPKEIELDCSCPDWATMCKHVAAVLYGVGSRLDEKPELLFLLRGVDHRELVSEDAAQAIVERAPARRARALDEGILSDVFGIDLARAAKPAREFPGRRKTPRRKREIAGRSKGKATTSPQRAAGIQAGRRKQRRAATTAGRPKSSRKSK